ncbi:MAG: pilin [Lachnospiraceae bacterium]|nr:pilin [Lachnospiraceae bacterium]
MKNINEKRVTTAFTVILAMMTFMTLGVSAESGFAGVVQPIVDLLDSLMTPILAIVGAAGSLYCVLLGVKFIKAEEPQDREKAKSHLKNAIIGFVLIFVLMLALKLLMPVMIKWVENNGSAGTL